MTTSGSDRFERLEILFHGALEIVPEERAGWLEQRSEKEGWEADPSLVAEVLDLLQEDSAGAAGHLEGIVDSEMRQAALKEGEFERTALDKASPEEIEPGEADLEAETLDLVEADIRSVARSRADFEDPGQVGPYRILGRLGRGGLATVYLAERQGEFSMPVALKRIRRGMDTEDILERLRLERQILSRLVHPNICRIHDGGSDDTGRPYLVMEVIEGEPLDDWCANRSLPLEGRLEVFAQVLEAVDYAHQNLVLHRDLKPSNILVTEMGVPKLLDFGIAKLLHGEVREDGSSEAVARTITRIEQRLLTPDYASPEQISGRALTTASDVYSLGVLLFELASGELPHQAAAQRRAGSRVGSGKGASRLAPWAERPSRAASWGSSNLDHLLPRVSEVARGARREESELVPPADRFEATHAAELDAVVAKALEPDPADRYRSVRELADDLARLRSDLPVRARQSTWHFRLRKMLRRHRAAASVAAVVLILIAMAVIGTSWQARVAEKERRVAESRRIEAEDLSRFLVDIFAVSDPYETSTGLSPGPGQLDGRPRGEAVTAREILDRASRSFPSSLGEASQRRRTLRHAIGRAYLNLSLHDEARRQLEAAVGSEDSPSTAFEVAVARDLAWLDALEGKFSAAEARLSAVEAFHVALSGPADPELAWAAQIRGEIELLRDNPAAAEGQYLRALDLLGRGDAGSGGGEGGTGLELTRLGGPDLDGSDNDAAEIDGGPDGRGGAPHHDPELRSRIETGLGSALYRQGRLDEATRIFERVLEDRRRRLGETHPHVVESFNNVAVASSEVGDFETAEEVFRGLLERQRGLLGEGHRDLVPILYNLAKTLERQGKLEEALQILEQARQVAERGDGVSQLLVKIYMLKGLLASRSEEPAMAAAAYRRALELSRHLFAGDHPQVVTLLARLAQVLTGEDPLQAESLLRQALDMAERVDPKQILEVRLALGDLALGSGRPEEAEGQFSRAAELVGADDTRPWLRGLVQLRQATALARLGRASESRRLAQAAAEDLAATLGPEHSWVAQARALVDGADS